MKNLKRILTMAFVMLSICLPTANATPFDLQGRVVYVDDGDTIVMLVDGNVQKKVRMASIDAPESSHTNREKGRIGQPYAKNSGDFLSSMVKGKTVSAHCYEQDIYGRNVCDIHADGVFVNREMVANGWAWANGSAGGRYMRDKSFPSLETEARKRKAGLWASSSPTAPWEWRDLCWKQGQCAQ